MEQGARRIPDDHPTTRAAASIAKGRNGVFSARGRAYDVRRVRGCSVSDSGMTASSVGVVRGDGEAPYRSSRRGARHGPVER
jgi:hypothetical protein